MIVVYSVDGVGRDRSRRDAQLRECLSDYWDRSGAEGAPELRRTELGQPYFLGQEAHISITHCGSQWMCAVGASRIGVDVERVRRVDMAAIASLMFSGGEMDQLGDEAEFFRTWTRKEAYSKLIGQGLHAPFGGFDTTCPQALGVKFFDLPAPPGHVATLCLETPVDDTMLWLPGLDLGDHQTRAGPVVGPLPVEPQQGAHRRRLRPGLGLGGEGVQPDRC